MIDDDRQILISRLLHLYICEYYFLDDDLGLKVIYSFTVYVQV